jgi:hypothetical protein
MRRKAVGQPGEFLDRLTHRLIGDTLGGLDEIDVDRNPARIDPLVQLPNRLFGRRERAEPCTARSFWDTGLNPTPRWRLVEAAVVEMRPG